MPFPVTVYGVSRTTAKIDTNGIVSLTDPGGAKADNAVIPSAATPNTMVYAFWDDLVIDASASVRTETVGTAPNRKFVVEWRNAYFYDHGTGTRVTVSLAIGEDNSMTVYYSNIDANGWEQGTSATARVENSNGTTALPFSNNQPVFRTGMTIRYWKP